MTKAFKLLQASYTNLRAMSFAHAVARKIRVIHMRVMKLMWTLKS